MQKRARVPRLVRTSARRLRRAQELSRLGLVLGCAVSGIACSAGSDAPSDGALRGEVRIYRVTHLDGTQSREFYLSPDASSTELRQLVFSTPPDLTPWTRLKVWGEADADRIVVSRYEVEASPDTDEVAEALVAGPKRTRTAAFVIIDTGSGANLTAAAAQTSVFGTRAGTDRGLAQYYTETSYGTLNFTGEALGPTPVDDLGTCDTNSVVRIENRWPMLFGKTVDHWMTYLGGRYSNCGWSGIGGEGTAARPAHGSWYNATTGCVVLAQEVGHNLGLNHAGTMDCGTSIMPDDPRQGCTGAEYGNRYTPMGGACMHMNAYEKWYEGFLGGCNGVRVRQSGSFTLLPLALACDGVQALQIPMAKQRAFRNTSGTRDVTIGYYYLELRTRRGMDDRGTSGSVTGPTVLVHVVGDVPQPSIVSTFSWLLDMDPTTAAFDGLKLGQTYTDPAGGVSFTVQSIDNDRATINVTVPSGLGTSTCIDGTTFAPPGPASCTSGTGGSSGVGGAAGAGGGSGTGGVSGTGGSSGTAGVSGTGGAGGTGGNAGTSGSGGGAGASGQGGGTGSGGAGSGGTSGGTGGTGADAGSAGTPGGAGGTRSGGVVGASGQGVAGRSPGPAIDLNSNEDGACACRAASPARSESFGALVFAALGLLISRRRR